MILSRDERLSWPGAVSVEQSAAWSMPWRIDHSDRTLFHPALVERAAMPAGVRLVFRSNTQSLAGAVEPVVECSPLDLFCDGVHHGTAPLDGQSAFRFEDLPAKDKLLELWLPQYGEFRLRSLEIEENATLSPAVDARPRWITYGSSITQCRSAASPSMTWPAIVARGHGLNLTCLGFGGQCHLDSMVARQMRDLPADYLSICVGINIYGGETLNPRSFGAALTGFVQIVRERHAETPFVVLSPIFSPPREETLNGCGFTLQMMRDEIEGVVMTLRERGDRHLHYVDGRTLLGADHAHMLPDDLHPDPAGYWRMGGRFLDLVACKYFVA